MKLSTFNLYFWFNILVTIFKSENSSNPPPSPTQALLWAPRSPARTQTELCRWFGGRVPAAAVSIDLGAPYVAHEPRSKKAKKACKLQISCTH